MVRRREYHWVVFVVVAVLGPFFPREVHAGYTHYWKWKRTPDAPRLERAVAEMHRIVETKRDLVEVNDAGAPGVIVFNGIGAGAHEPFRFPGKPDFDFVKTEKKPYDAVVTACLIVARDHFTFDELEIRSDGTWDGWREGRDLYIDVLERQANNPMDAPLDDVAGVSEDDDVLDRAPASPPDGSTRLRAIGISVGIVGALVAVRLLMAGRG